MCVCVCVCVRRISHGGEGNALYTVLSSCVLWLQDDEDNMYTSIQELRDEADELQHAMEECEGRGDVAQLEQLQQKLQQTQSMLLEKREERHLARYFKLIISLRFCLPHPLLCDYHCASKVSPGNLFVGLQINRVNATINAIND